MSMTLEDTANSAPVYAGHRKIIREDREYALRLSKIFGRNA